MRAHIRLHVHVEVAHIHVQVCSRLGVHVHGRCLFKVTQGFQLTCNPSIQSPWA